METYKYPKSQELFQKSAKVVPSGIYGHLGPGEGCFMPIDAYPLYAEKAKGSYFWDIDGNKFIDYMCAYGPNVLGYNDPDVDNAFKEQLKKGNCISLASARLPELAELLVDTIDSADWAFFAKNGGDVTAMAALTAKAATGRSKMLMLHGGYHGVAPWMQQIDYSGIAKEDVANNLYADFGNFSQIKRIVYENKGQIAGLISTPYHHPALADNMLPPEGYWQKVRDLCTQEGIVLIVDDVRCGFRLDVHGSDHRYGFNADLLTYCKALANGYNISALVGRESLQDAAASVFYTGSYWLSAAPMAAAIACITKMREMDLAKVCLEKGKKITDGLVEVAANNGFHLKVSGETSMWFMRTTGYEDIEDPNNMLHQAFIGECVRRGVFLANHHNLFINASLTDKDIEQTLEVADEAYRVIRKDVKNILGKGF